MHTIETIQQFAVDYGFKPMYTKKEMKDLPGLLHDNETVMGLLEAQFKDVNNRASSGYGLVIVTDQRVLCYRKSFIGTVTSEELPLAKITGISYRKGLMLGSVIVTAAGNQSIYDGCNNKDAEKFANIVKELLAHANSTTPASQQPSNLEQIEKLFEMHQKGMITDDEFAAAKSKLLS